MIRRFPSIVPVVALAAMLGQLACTKSNPLIGTWRAQNQINFNGYPSQAYLTYKFNDNGTFVRQDFIKTPTGTFSTDFAGKYTFKDGALSITLTDVLQVKGGTGGFADKMRKDAEKNLNIKAQSSVIFKGDKQLEMTAEKQTFSFKRVE